MTEKFKVGDRVIPKSSFAVQDIYTIIAVGEPSIQGYPAWLKTHSQAFGQITDLEYMKLYFEPGYFRLNTRKTRAAGDRTDVRWYQEDPGADYERVTVTKVKEDDEQSR